MFRSLRRCVHTERRIHELGLVLPELPQPAGAYTLGVQEGGWVHLAGHLPFKPDMKTLHTGRLGFDLTAEEGQGGRKILADVLEALIGAVALQDGIACAGHAFARVVLPPPSVLSRLASGEIVQVAGRHRVVPRPRHSVKMPVS